MEKYIVRDLTSGISEFDNLADAEKRFIEFPNSTEIVQKEVDGSEKTIGSRTHKEVGVIEINNKCVYLKVPFFQPSDRLEITISKIGETPEKLRSKMEVIDEKWNTQSTL